MHNFFFLRRPAVENNDKANAIEALSRALDAIRGMPKTETYWKYANSLPLSVLRTS